MDYSEGKIYAERAIELKTRTEYATGETYDTGETRETGKVSVDRETLVVTKISERIMAPVMKAQTWSADHAAVLGRALLAAKMRLENCEVSGSQIAEKDSLITQINALL